MNPNRIRRNSRELQQAARGMRREPTEAEDLLWEMLRGRRLDGLRFRRQHPVGRFVLDFYCPVHKLVIEVDGEVHDTQKERDAERTAVIEAHGYRIIRFRNEEVLYNLPSVLARIRTAISPESPPLLLSGEGAGG
ncbi:MAG TPA: endonuclease domain-containing protein [Longimicrobiaceae bacterium]